MRDRRREFRESVLTTAKIGFADGRFPIRCVLHNISPSGAKLVLPAAVDLPADFLLRFAGENIEYLAEARWLQGIALGVELKRPIDARVLDIWRVQLTRSCLAA